ncbi:hypothetical protein GSG79_004278 [Escherichia coli]|jgi:hypothetical protein|nr:hypothetical protein [Escherichia coli]EGN2600689.1 hypothetical protein [Salmonella enterica]
MDLPLSYDALMRRCLEAEERAGQYETAYNELVERLGGLSAAFGLYQPPEGEQLFRIDPNPADLGHTLILKP